MHRSRPDPGLAGNGLVSFLGKRTGFQAFTEQAGEIIEDVFLPRYYDPETTRELAEMETTCRLTTVGELAAAGIVELETGDEVGKIAYGGGSIPFVRTSDLGNWELKHDPKQLVAEAVYDQYTSKQSVQADDILVVRDGTYLVGTSGLVAETDLPLLFSGGIYRLRVIDRRTLDPYLLLALLNSRIVRRQMRNKQFTRDVIDTLGRRLEEVVLPLPLDDDVAAGLAQVMRSLVQRRAELRKRVHELGVELEAAA